MKKVLALILAVLMFAALAVSAVSADDEYPTLDVRHMDAYGQDNTYLGDTPIAVAPVQDGVISLGEYQQKVVISKDGGEANKEWISRDLLFGDIEEYYAYDNDNFYCAFVLPQEKGAAAIFEFNGVDSPDSKAFNPKVRYLLGDADHVAKSWMDTLDNTSGGYGVKVGKPGNNINSEYWLEGELQPAGALPMGTSPKNTEVGGNGVKIETQADEAAKKVVYEFKFKKKALAKTFRLAGEEAADTITFMGLSYSFAQTYQPNLEDYSKWMETADKVVRQWYPQVDDNGDRADWLLDDEGIGGGTYRHFVHFTAAPEIQKPTTAAPTTAAPTTAAPTTVAPETEASATADAATEASATGAPATEAPAEDEGGCKSVVTLSALAIVPVLAGGIIIARKKED